MSGGVWGIFVTRPIAAAGRVGLGFALIAHNISTAPERTEQKR